MEQATKDLTTHATVAMEAPEHLRIQKIEEAQLAWATTAADFWRAHSGGNSAEAKPTTPAKLHRSKAAIFLAASQHQLQAACGRGWEAFVVPAVDTPRPPPSAWPAITVSLDQGSDGWAAMNFLCWHKRVNALVIPDASHRVWNDTENALKAAGLWPTCLLGIVLLNLDIWALGTE